MKYRIEIDDNPENPREWDNLGIMVCYHRRYRLGDVQGESDGIPEDALAVLPLYLYDHSGITMNTTGFTCPWDSGQVGWIYTTEDQCKAFGVDSNDKDKLKEILRDEVEIYDSYIRGDVFGFIIEDDEGNEIFSSWGYYDRKYVEKEAEETMRDLEKVPNYCI